MLGIFRAFCKPSRSGVAGPGSTEVVQEKEDDLEGNSDGDELVDDEGNEYAEDVSVDLGKKRLRF